MIEEGKCPPDKQMISPKCTSEGHDWHHLHWIVVEVSLHLLHSSSLQDRLLKTHRVPSSLMSCRVPLSFVTKSDWSLSPCIEEDWPGSLTLYLFPTSCMCDTFHPTLSFLCKQGLSGWWFWNIGWGGQLLFWTLPSSPAPPQGVHAISGHLDNCLPL